MAFEIMGIMKNPDEIGHGFAALEVAHGSSLTESLPAPFQHFANIAPRGWRQDDSQWPAQLRHAGFPQPPRPRLPTGGVGGLRIGSILVKMKRCGSS
jgi:hypothetical protein